MKRFTTIMIVVLLLSCLCSAVFAEGVSDSMATITGKVTLNGISYSEKVNSTYVCARSSDGYSASAKVNEDGTYSINVNTPADGTVRTFEVYAEVNLKSFQEFYAGARVKVKAISGGVYNQNFSQDMATLNISASFTNDDWDYLSLYSMTDSMTYNMKIVNSGEYTIDIPANMTFVLSGGAYPKRSDKYDSLSLDQKMFEAKPGEVVNLTWDGTFPEKKVVEYGRIHGTISYSPLPEGNLTSHTIMCNSCSDLNMNADGDYSFDNVVPGDNINILVNSHFNNGQSLWWPSKLSQSIALSAGEDKVKDFKMIPTMVKGRVSISGSLSLRDLKDEYNDIHAEGIQGDTEGGSSRGNFDKKTGEYALYLTPGKWDMGDVSFYYGNNSSDPMQYMNGSTDYISTTTANAVSVEPGQVLSGVDRDIPTGLITVKFISKDGSLIKSPSISGDMRNIIDENTSYVCYVRGNGPREALKETQATIAAVPGTYNLEIGAYINDSYVSFDPKTVTVEKGAHIVLEVNGPTVNVTSPKAEFKADSDKITVKGTATGKVAVSSVKINGNEAKVTSASNRKDSGEVQFEGQISLSEGKNEIKTAVTDSSGKISYDTRYVYFENKIPVLSVEPGEIHLNKNALTDVTATIYGSTPVSIMNGTGVLIPEKDYSISGNTITIKKGYLNYYFTKFPDQNLYLNISLSNGKNVILTVYTGVTAHPEINTVNLTYTGADVKTVCVLSGNYIASIKNDNSPLVQKIDYTYSPATHELIIRKGFLAVYFSKSTYDLKLNVKFTGGDVKTVTIHK